MVRCLRPGCGATVRAMPPTYATGNAVNDLGLGASLSQQVQGETEEERKRRLAQMQQARLTGPSASMAVTSLFGARGV